MKIYNKIPKIGDRRINVKFAFTPIRITDRLVIWLQFYREVQWYKEIEVVKMAPCAVASGTIKKQEWVHGYNTLQKQFAE